MKGLAKQTNNERFAYDSYRRFVQMFGKIVLDVPGDLFEEALHELVEEKGVSVDTELSAEDLAGLVETFKEIVRGRGAASSSRPIRTSSCGTRSKPCSSRGTASARATTADGGHRRRPRHRGQRADDGVRQQGRRLRHRCRVHAQPVDRRERCRTATSSTNAQGEDVVAGIRITEPLDAMGNEFPESHEQLLGVMELLENHYRDMCDIEFTIEQGRLFMLQTRVGKRTAAAALRMAVEMEQEGLIDKREAVLRVQPAQLDQLLHPQFDPKAEFTVLAKGLNASPGAAVGKVYFTADDAEARHEAGERVILVRPETSPDDLHGMIAAEGILTSRGGLVSHAAVVARGMGKPAICGADAVKIDLAREAVRGRRHDRAARVTSSRSRGRPARSSSARSRSSRPSRPATSARSSAGPTSSAR